MDAIVPAPAGLMTRKEAAVYLRIAPATLARWDAEDRYGLPSIKIGSRVRYRAVDLEHFVARNTRCHQASQSQAGEPGQLASQPSGFAEATSDTTCRQLPLPTNREGATP